MNYRRRRITGGRTGRHPGGQGEGSQVHEVLEQTALLLLGVATPLTPWDPSLRGKVRFPGRVLVAWREGMVGRA